MSFRLRKVLTSLASLLKGKENVQCHLFVHIHPFRDRLGEKGQIPNTKKRERESPVRAKLMKKLIFPGKARVILANSFFFAQEHLILHKLLKKYFSHLLLLYILHFGDSLVPLSLS